MQTRISEDELEEFRKHGFLSTHMALEARLAKAESERRGAPLGADHRAMSEVLSGLDEAIRLFNEKVWLLWLYSRQALEPTHRYLEAKIDDVHMLVGSMAGRVMITLRWANAEPEEEHHFVSLLGGEDMEVPGDRSLPVVYGLCGFQGIGMNGEQAIKLVHKTVQLSKELAKVLTPASKGVTLA